MNWPIDYLNQAIQGNCLAVLKTIPDESVNCCITSPPYWGLRRYIDDDAPEKQYEIGLEESPEQYVAKMVEVFREVRRVLRDDGTCWINLGDSYFSTTKGSGGPSDKQKSNAGSWYEPRKFATPDGIKTKDLVGIPWRVAFALQADGWYLRQDIIWAKPNPMPESVTDRCTKSHEYIFMLSKSAKYFYDQEAIKEPAIYFDDDRKGRAQENHKSMLNEKQNGIRPADKQRGHGRRHAGFNDRWDSMTKTEQCLAMRNKRDVWTVVTKPYSEAHFATFPPALIEPMVLAGCPEGGIILDLFMGAGTTGMVAKMNYRNYIGIELNQKYIEIARKRIDQTLVNKKLAFK